LKKILVASFALFLILSLLSCSDEYPELTPEEKGAEVIDEVTPVTLNLDEKLLAVNPEFSGLAWYGDQLLMLPQFPNRIDSKGSGSIPYIMKDSIYAYLDNKTSVLVPQYYRLYAYGLEDFMQPGSGYEAITVVGDDVFINIESVRGISTTGFIVKGKINPEEKTITLNEESLTEINQIVEIFNFSDEAIVYNGNKVFTLYEANGRNVNPFPVAHIYSTNLDPLGAIPAPSLEYRITDATGTDSRNRFWAINYFYPGEYKQLNPAVDSLVVKFGVGNSHLESGVVERLVEFEIGWDKITLTDTPPVILKLDKDKTGRNWEGIARLDDKGFILVKDFHPDNLPAFVPYNFNNKK